MDDDFNFLSEHIEDTQSGSQDISSQPIQNAVTVNENDDIFETLDLEESTSDEGSEGDDDEEEEEIVLTEEKIKMAKEMDHLSDESLMELIAYNESYLEIIQKLIEKTDRSVLENMESMEMIQEQIAEEENGEHGQVKVSLQALDKPYFKDYRGVTAKSNLEAVELYKNHLLPTLLKEDVPWTQRDLNRLRKGVRRSILKDMNSQYRSRIYILKDKVKNFSAANTDEDRMKWQEESAALKRKIDYNESLPDNEIFTGDYSKVDWVEVAMHDLNGDKTPIQAKMKWCNEECPEINKSEWTEKEDNILKENALQTWTNWKFIIHEMGSNRSEFQAICRAKELTLRIFKEPQMWSPEEDEKLLSIISNCRNTESVPWDKVSKLLGTRTANQCKVRFKQSLINYNHQGKWQEHEDIFLLDAVNKYGPIDWDKISSFVPGRNARQCRARYMNTLDVNRNVETWTPEDDELLLRLTTIVGRGVWSEISPLFPGRTPLDLRARYKSYVLNVYHGRKINYNTVPTQTKFLQDRKDQTISRIKGLEESESINEAPSDNVFKRFGIGGYVMKEGKAVLRETAKERLGKFHIFTSGVYRKPILTDDRRLLRHEKLLENMNPEDRENFERIRRRVEVLKKEKEEKLAKIEAMLDGEEKVKAIAEMNEEDSTRLTKLLKETVTVQPNDKKLIARKKLPRVMLRRRYPKRYQQKMDPKVAEKKLREAALLHDVKKRYDVIRELPIIPQLVGLLGLKEHQAYHKDGSVRRIQDLVLMEDDGGNYYWATTREELILNFLEDLNKCLFSGSMSRYETQWRLQSSARCQEYFRNLLRFETLPPMIFPDRTQMPNIEDYKELVSDVMLPCRATLTGLEQYRVKGRKICNKNASVYFDQLNKEAGHTYLSDPDTARLDVRLSKSVTDSADYQLLRARMFKMFFLPMIMEYGQRSKDHKEKLMEKIEVERRRRVYEKEFEENGEHSNVVFRHQVDSILLGPSTAKLNFIKPDIGIIDMDRKVDDSINSVLQMVSKSTKKASNRVDAVIESVSNLANEERPQRRVSTRKKKPTSTAGASTIPTVDSTASIVCLDTEAQEENQEPPPKKRRRGRKKKNDNAAEIILPSTAEFLDAAPPGMEVVMINPTTAEETAAVEAYRPRWIKQKLKNRQENDGELTLADLLFVRGKKQKRAPVGLYDLEHTETLMDTLRPTVLSQHRQSSSNTPIPMSEFDEAVSVKRELIDSSRDE